jgi:D-alanyl-D-alanine carboxypeptidase/D-alanyl-D-alanine-endopeptidase (penicillin-binding protein 4)
MRFFLTLLILSTITISLNAQSTNSAVDETELVNTNKFKVNNSHRLVKQLKKLPVFENSYSGLCVFDVEKGEYLVEYNSDKYFTPASNTKLFTFYSGLENIGDKIPVLFYTENADSLIIWGSGSPTLLYSVFDDSTAFNFLNNSEKEIYFSESNFLNKRYGSGWSWDDYNDEYSKELTPLSVYGNAVKVTLYPNGEWTVNPKQFRDSIEVLGYGDRFKLKRKEKENRFEMWLTNSMDTLTKEVPFITSTALSLKLLSDSLKKDVTLINRGFDNDEISTLYGIEADSIYKVLLQKSDNYLAESVMMMSAENLGQRDSIKMSLQINTVLDTLLSDISQRPRWVDGSGLSRYNLFTPQSMVEILLKIRTKVLETDGNMDKVFELLPTGGNTGTLDGRFKDYPQFIYAKTGTLSNNHNLSGYIVTKSGKLLVFSYMNNHYRYKTSTIQKQTDTILKDFYLYY